MVNEIKSTQQTQINSQANNNSKSALIDNQNKGNIASKLTKSDADRVNLTDTAEKLRDLENQVANQPVVDSKRVDSIKKAIADGTFQVNVSQTAEKLAQFENLLQSKAGEDK